MQTRVILKPRPDWLGADRDLEQELKEVERRILHQASLFDSGAEAYVRYAWEGGGKRLRPALVLLAGIRRSYADRGRRVTRSGG